MDIKISSEQEQTTLYLSGNIDIPGSETLKGVLSQIIEDGSVKYVILDFENVSFIGSCGVGRLLLFYKKFSLKGGKIRITNLNEELTGIFCTLNLDKLFKIIDD
jgi:anti-anti-sigma factor